MAAAVIKKKIRKSFIIAPSCQYGGGAGGRVGGLGGWDSLRNTRRRGLYCYWAAGRNGCDASYSEIGETHRPGVCFVYRSLVPNRKSAEWGVNDTSEYLRYINKHRYNI